MITFLLSALLILSDKENCPNTYDTLAQQRVYTYVDMPPQFPGGDAALNKHIMDNLKYPKDNEDVQASISLQFIVQADGKLTHIVIPGKVAGKYTKLDKEVIRMAGAMPRWKPGRCDGVAVPVRMPFRIGCIMPQE